MTQEQYIEQITQQPTAWLGHGGFAVRCVETLKPKLVVDLGVDYGYSTFCFAWPRVGKVVGIDCFEGDPHAGKRDTYEYVEGLRQRLGMDNVEFIKGYFEDIAKGWKQKIDILHIDGMHDYESVKQDFETWTKFLRPGGLVLFHDTRSFPNDVGRFFKELEGYKHEFLEWHGLGVWSDSEATLKAVI